MTLKQTPLHELHRKLGAKMVDFGGWDMPLIYSSIVEEHNKVREQCGLFDVSHMGEIELTGPEALQFAEYLVPNYVGRLELDQVLYTPLCYEHGGTVDDLLIYRLPDIETGGERFLLVVNAANTEKDLDWVKSHASKFNVNIRNASREYAQIAIQGPEAEGELQRHIDLNLSRVRFFNSIEGEHYKEPILISRTGYTGEDGFEIYGPPQTIAQLWKDLIKAGVAPIGLGARDSLRFEACLALYGHELDKDTTPVEAGLGWTVKKKPGIDYLGKEVLLEQKASGVRKKLVGFKMTEPGVAREGYKLFAHGAEIGYVTSGMKSITLEQFLGLGYVDNSIPGNAGDKIEIEIRSSRKTAEIISTPFYRGSVKSP